MIMKLVFLLFCFLERRCVGEVTIPAGALTMCFNGLNPDLYLCLFYHIHKWQQDFLQDQRTFWIL